MSANLESIKNRIRALAAKTVENGCTEAEAMSAMEMVGKLLQTYNLSMTQVEIEAETYEHQTIHSNRKQKHAVYFCASAIAKFTNTKCWFNRTSAGIIYTFFGQASDALMAKYIYDLIVRSIDSETDKFKKSDDWQHAYNRKSATVSFQLGMASRIAKRLKDMTAQNNADLNAARGSNALVVLKMQLVEKAYSDNGGEKLRTVKAGSRANDYNAYSKGGAAGDKVNLSRPLNQGKGVAEITGY
jgi:hypothetical protein